MTRVTSSVMTLHIPARYVTQSYRWSAENAGSNKRTLWTCLPRVQVCTWTAASSWVEAPSSTSCQPLVASSTLTWPSTRSSWQKTFPLNSGMRWRAARARTWSGTVIMLDPAPGVMRQPQPSATVTVWWVQADLFITIIIVVVVVVIIISLYSLCSV